MTTTTDRFDVPSSVRDFLQVAIDTTTWDATDMALAGARFDLTSTEGILAIVDEVLEDAFGNRHSDDRHAKCVAAAEKVWKAVK